MSQQNQQNQQNQENDVRQQNPYAQPQAGYGAAPGGYSPYYGGYADPTQQYGYGYQQPQDFQAQYQQPQAGFQFPQYPQFPMTPGFDQGPGLDLAPDVPGMLPIEQSYIENILRLNKGKLATVYMTFENNKEWNAKVFKGVIEAAGRDHIIISDPQTGMRYLLLMVYLDYVTFDEELQYEYPYGAGVDISTYPPR